jgi:hypothetical protein
MVDAGSAFQILGGYLRSGAGIVFPALRFAGAR